MQFAPHIEQWRPLVAKYFPPDQVDKALWVIQWESSGNPGADNGAATGLFQIESLPGRPDRESLKDPEANIRYAAQNLGAANGNWKPWGENNTYNGQRFGALGNHPFPGTGAASGSQPVNGRAMTSWATAPITQGFGPTNETLDSGYGGAAHFNKGYDYGIPVGTPIDATVGGTVIAAGDQGDGWGISVKVRDAQGYVHNYGHLSGANVKVGDQIGAGAVVGASGNTGASTGPHLSYDVLDPEGNFVDPGRWVGGGVVDNYQELELPFDYATYLTKSARFAVLDAELAAAEASFQAPDPGKVAEWGRLQAELTTYEEKAKSGGQSFDDYLKRLQYENENNPALIDAQNAANKFARQLQINEGATNKTQNDMAQQRADQESAETSQANWRGSSAFSGPLGFRVGSTDLPTEEEVFQKNIAQISNKLPEVPDIPYSKPLSAFGGTTVRNSQNNWFQGGGTPGYPSGVEGPPAPTYRYPAGVEGPPAPAPSIQPNALGIYPDGQDGSQVQGPQQSAFGTPQLSNPLLDRMNSYSRFGTPQVAGPPASLGVAQAAKRFVGTLFGGRR